MVAAMLVSVPDWLQVWHLQFKHPERLWAWLLIPLFLGLYVFLSRRRSRRGMRYTNTAVLGQIAHRQRRWLRHLAVVMSLLTLLTLVFAFAIPMAKTKVPRERATVVLTIDVSQSMAATDVAPTRLDAVKQTAAEFIDGLPTAYNVAVVALSGNPSLRLPPTTDHSAAKRMVQSLSLQDGTAIGDAISLSLDALNQAPKGSDGSAPPAIIALLSDGASDRGQAPQQAAGAAKDKGVKVYTVAYGTRFGKVNLDGESYVVPPDEALMKEIAQISGGEQYTAKDGAQLKNAYGQLKSAVGYEDKFAEVTAQWAGLGIVFGLLAAIAAVMMAARWPS